MPSTLRCRPGSALARCRCWASERSRMSLTSVDLPDPDTPGHRDEAAERERHVDVVQVVLPGAAHRHDLTRARPAPGRHRDRLLARQVLARDGRLVREQPAAAADRAGVHDVAAVLPRARADVDHVVGGADGLLVVLDHDHRVAQVAQPLQGGDEALVVALVQADGRLVEHVEDADEAAADLAGQADALRLTARERPGRAGQRQVVEADVEQELHALADFLEDPVGDHVLAVAAARGSPWRRRRCRWRGCTARRCSARRR